MKIGAAMPAAAPSLSSPLLVLVLELSSVLSVLGGLVWMGELPPSVWGAAVNVVVSWEASVGRSAETETVRVAEVDEGDQVVELKLQVRTMRLMSAYISLAC